MAEQHSNRKQKPPCICRCCGKEYFNKIRSKTEGNKYCSRECAFKDIKAWHMVGPESTRVKQCLVYWPACEVCDKAFLARQKNQRLCSDDCKKEQSRIEARIRNQITYQRDRTPRSCKCCGKVFAPEYGDKRSVYCSDVCATRDGKHSTRKAKKRAEHYGVEYEYVNPIKVFERDGWRCQICGKPTPRNKRGKMVSNAPELDHRVPVSIGGPHTYGNTQCSCRQCNGDKGNTRQTGQLPLLHHAT